jgi:hypothetical protein
MLLRRLTKYIKEQNWFAVGLDFFIVVIGVGVAMLGQHWLSDRTQREDMRLAELALQQDLELTYFYAKERLALIDCRKESYQFIAQQLLESKNEWIGLPRPIVTDNPLITNVLPTLLRSPSRTWGSPTWHAEFRRGTFNQMNNARRSSLDGIFTQSKIATQVEDHISTLQGRVNVLAVSTTLGKSDRLRYYENTNGAG